MYACSLEISIILVFIQNLGSKKKFLWRKKSQLLSDFSYLWIHCLAHYLLSRYMLVGVHLQGHVSCSMSIAKLSFPCVSWRTSQICRISKL